MSFNGDHSKTPRKKKTPETKCPSPSNVNVAPAFALLLLEGFSADHGTSFV